MIVLVVLVICTFLVYMQSSNLAMKFYEQLEVMPIQLGVTLVFWIIGGLVVLDEAKYYETI